LLDILKNYFCHATKYHPEPYDAGKTTFFSSVGATFIVASADALCNLQPTSPLFSQHEDLLRLLTTSLQDLHDDLVVHPTPDYLFFASLLYSLYLFRYGPDYFEKIIETDIGQNLILAILQYHARIPRLRRDIEEEFYNTALFTFGNDWPEFIERAERLGVVLPAPVAPAVQLQRDLPSIEGAEIQELLQPSGGAIVDIRVIPLSERSFQDNAFAHSPSRMDSGDAKT